MTSLIRQMGHVAFTSADPEAAALDLIDLVGLRVTHRAGGVVYLSSNARAYEIALHPAAKPGVLAIGLEAMNAKAVDEIAVRVKSEGFEILSDRPLGPATERAVRFRLPGAGIFEVHTAVKRSESAFHVGPGPHSRRIEHVNIKVADTRAVRDMFMKIFSMKLSDRTSGDEFMWFRAADGYHHTLAICPGEGTLHHYAFDHTAVEDLTVIGDTLAAKDRSLLWGPGRHGAGGNIFTYYIDPNGCVVENSVQMERIENDDLYEPRTWQISPTLADRWINLWGSPPPKEFLDPELPFVTEADAVPGRQPKRAAG